MADEATDLHANDVVRTTMRAVGYCFVGPYFWWHLSAEKVVADESMETVVRSWQWKTFFFSLIGYAGSETIATRVFF